ncbi:MAG: hypothetical protein KA135_06190, partial [Halioglobus sp.]|nr:hypothetical protein [Halioglobus sp.]
VIRHLERALIEESVAQREVAAGQHCAGSKTATTHQTPALLSKRRQDAAILPGAARCGGNGEDHT